MLVPGGRISRLTKCDFLLALYPALGIMVLDRRQQTASRLQAEGRRRRTEVRDQKFKVQGSKFKVRTSYRLIFYI